MGSAFLEAVGSGPERRTTGRDGATRFRSGALAAGEGRLTVPTIAVGAAPVGRALEHDRPGELLAALDVTRP